ncbi:MAG: hypothetical protein ABIZ49_03575, partial [Opitutaceae bacterium]
MIASSILPPPPRVAPNPRHAFGGIFRLTVRRFLTPAHFFTVLAMLAALVVFSIPVASSRGEAAREFMPWIVMFYLSILVPVIAFINAGGTIRDDLKPTSVDYVLTRPVARPAFIVFRYLSHVACAQVDFLFGLLVVAGIGIYRGVPEFAAALPSLLLG